MLPLGVQSVSVYRYHVMGACYRKMQPQSALPCVVWQRLNPSGPVLARPCRGPDPREVSGAPSVHAL